MKLNYQQRILLALQHTEKQFDPGLVILNVAHDDNCPALKTGKNCNCVPDISFNVDDKKYSIDEEGVLHS
jgi:hypothetical protein